MIAILSVLTALLIAWHERRHPTIASDLSTVGWITALQAALTAVGSVVTPVLETLGLTAPEAAATIGAGTVLAPETVGIGTVLAPGGALSGTGGIGGGIAGAGGGGLAGIGGGAAEALGAGGISGVLGDIGQGLSPAFNSASNALFQTAGETAGPIAPEGTAGLGTVLQAPGELAGQGGLGGGIGGSSGFTSPGLLTPTGVIGAPLAAIGGWIAEHPIASANITAMSYKTLRDQFKQPQATAVSPREKPAPLQAPQFGAQVNRAIASPLDRFRAVLGGR